MRKGLGIPALLVVGLVLSGCGGGDDGGAPLEPPQFNLTGQWVVTEFDCGSDASLDPALAEIEAEALGGMIRVVQMGNDLEITDLDSGTRYDGTISGDQVRYEYSASLGRGAVQVDIYAEAEGTVLDADHVVETGDVTFTYADGSSALVICTSRYQRV